MDFPNATADSQAAPFIRTRYTPSANVPPCSPTEWEAIFTNFYTQASDIVSRGRAHRPHHSPKAVRRRLSSSSSTDTDSPPRGCTTRPRPRIERTVEGTTEQTSGRMNPETHHYCSAPYHPTDSRAWFSDRPSTLYDDLEELNLDVDCLGLSESPRSGSENAQPSADVVPAENVSSEPAGRAVETILISDSPPVRNSVIMETNSSPGTEDEVIVLARRPPRPPFPRAAMKTLPGAITTPVVNEAPVITQYALRSNTGVTVDQTPVRKRVNARKTVVDEESEVEDTPPTNKKKRKAGPTLRKKVTKRPAKKKAPAETPVDRVERAETEVVYKSFTVRHDARDESLKNYSKEK